MLKSVVLIFMAGLLVSVTLVDSAHLFVFPLLMKSHFHAMMTIVTELARRGHIVDVAIPQSSDLSSAYKSADNIHFVYYKLSCDPTHAIETAIDDALNEKGNIWRSMLDITTTASQVCPNIMSENEELFVELESRSYDLAMLDARFPMKCLYLLPHRLNIPFVSMADAIEPWLVRIPWFPSYVPVIMTEFSDNMNFQERLVNTFSHLMFNIIISFTQPPADLVHKYREYGPIHSIDDLVSETQLWLYTSDPALDYVKPIMPNVKLVGGLTGQPGKPLPDYLAEKVAGSPQGFILVTFGSSVSKLPNKLSQKLLYAFGKLDYLVIWHFNNNNNLEVPSNVFLMDWLPQNDLLADNNIKLFITHCGKNSLYETLYHALPVVCVPLMNDAIQNSKIIRTKGYGNSFNIYTADKEEVFSVISGVIEDPVYKQNIDLGSEILRSHPDTPAERSAYWIEHIIKFGGNHLRSNAFELHWTVYYMLDILLVLAIILVCSLYMTWKIVKCVFHIFCKSKSPDKHKQKQN